MTSGARVRRFLRHAMAGGLVMCLGATPPLAAAQTERPRTTGDRPASGVDAQAAAMEEFQKRLDAYLELRQTLSKKLKPISTTLDAAELTARQEALAAALQSARKGAKQGDLIPLLAAAEITKTVAADFRRRNASVERATLKEVPNQPRPVINRTYPQQEALPTVPPLLLNNLPRLPDNLQYRFYGRHVVILDGDVQIIVDYIANALPPQ